MRSRSRISRIALVCTLSALALLVTETALGAARVPLRGGAWAVELTPHRAASLTRHKAAALRVQGATVVLVDRSRLNGVQLRRFERNARSQRLLPIAPTSKRRACPKPPRVRPCVVRARTPREAVRLARRDVYDFVVIRLDRPLHMLYLRSSGAKRTHIVALARVDRKVSPALLRRLILVAAGDATLDLGLSARSSKSGTKRMLVAVSRLRQERGSAPGGDKLPPSAPPGLRVTASTSGSITVQWTASKDNVGVAGYTTYREGTSVDSTLARSHTYSGLACGTGYALAVDAYDRAGNRSGKARISATTSACPPPAFGGLVPPARANTVVNAPAGTTVQPDTFYRDPLGSLRYPNDLQRVTVVGAKNMPNYVRNWKDVWVEGKPGEPMNLGPGENEDLMQIKRYPSTAQLPEDLTFRYFRMHDLRRTDSSHTDGLQLMAGRNIRFLDGVSENVDVQPFFLRDGGREAGGGPIEDILFQRITVTGTSGYYAFRVSGNEEASSGGNVPTRVKIIDCAGDKDVSIDRAAARLGSQAINYRRI